MMWKALSCIDDRLLKNSAIWLGGNEDGEEFGASEDGEVESRGREEIKIRQSKVRHVRQVMKKSGAGM